MKFPNLVKVVTMEGMLVRNESGTLFYLPDFHILHYLASKLKFQYTIIEKKSNHEIFKDLLEGKADIGLGLISINVTDFQYADFSVSYETLDTRFIIERGSEGPKFEMFASPFKGDVWLSVVFISAVSAFLFRKATNSSLSHIFLSILGSLFKQSMDIKTDGFMKRIFHGAWYTWAGAISSFYIALFISYMTIPTKQWIPKNFEDLSYAVKNKGFIARSAPVFTLEMLKSDQEHLRILGQEMGKNGWYLYDWPDLPEIGPKEAFIHGRKVLDLIELHPPNRVKVYSKDALKILSISIVMRKTMGCMEQLNLAILQGIETGLFDVFQKQIALKSIWRKELRTLEWSDDTSSDIRLTELQYAFYVLLIGYLSSLIVFLCECLKGQRRLEIVRALRWSQIRKSR